MQLLKALPWAAVVEKASIDEAYILLAASDPTDVLGLGGEGEAEGASAAQLALQRAQEAKAEGEAWAAAAARHAPGLQAEVCCGWAVAHRVQLPCRKFARQCKPSLHNNMRLSRVCPVCLHLCLISFHAMQSSGSWASQSPWVLPPTDCWPSWHLPLPSQMASALCRTRPQRCSYWRRCEEWECSCGRG